MREPWVIVGGTTGPGGLQVHTAELARALSAAEHPVTIACTSTDHFSPLLAGSGVRVVRIDEPARGRPDVLFRRWSRAFRPLAGPVAVLCRAQAGEGHPAILAALRRRFGRLYTIEHRLPDPSDCGRSLRQRIRDRISARMIHRAFTVSDAVREWLIRQASFPADRVVTCPNWVDTDHFRPDEGRRDEFRTEHGIGRDSLLVGYVGRLAPEKRLDLLIRAFAGYLETTSRPATLALVGRGWKERELQGLAGDLGVADRVLFPGWHADPTPWYRAFDLFVLASVLEGFPLVVLEAMACGTFCVVHSSQGAEEWVENDRNGFVVTLDRPDDLVAWLQRIALLEPARVAELRQRARKTAVESFGRGRRLGELLTRLGAPAAAERLRADGFPKAGRSFAANLDD